MSNIKSWMIVLTMAMMGCQSPQGPDPAPANNSHATNNATTPSDAPDAPDPTGGLDLANVSYATRVSESSSHGSTNGGGDVPITLCELLNWEHDFVGIVEVVRIGDLQTPAVCEDKKYVVSHRDAELVVVATAFGSQLPGATIEAVRLAGIFERLPAPREHLLVAMRLSQGEWFMLREIVAARPGEYEPASDEREVDIPADFAVLSSEATAIVTDFENACPEYSERQVATDEGYAVYVRTPRCGSPVSDDAGIYPPDVSVGRD